MLNLQSPIQYRLLAQLDVGAAQLFLPSQDVWAKSAFKRGLARLFGWPAVVASLEWLLLLFMPIALLLLPFYLLRWWLRQRRAQPGWRVDFAARELRPELQPGQATLALDGALGVLCHGRTIELTHPERGPVATLLQAAPMQAADAEQLNRLAAALARRLGLRVVGLRADHRLS